MEHLDLIPTLLGGQGVEIGAFKTPLPGIKPIYLDRFAEYAGEKTLADYLGDACHIPFADSSLDYVASSHVIEHVANPFAALREWYRVLRHGGVIYMVVPDRRRTFDHTRPLTPVAHLLEDFRRGTTQVDGTHIDDFIYGVDWSLFSPDTPATDVATVRESIAFGYREAIRVGTEINIHFHTFESATAVEMIESGNRGKVWSGKLRIGMIQENFPASNPNGFLVVAHVQKTLRERLLALPGRKGLLPSAQRIAPTH